jgi:outer membrane receptor for ferrienterochelin and colicin
MVIRYLLLNYIYYTKATKLSKNNNDSTKTSLNCLSINKYINLNVLKTKNGITKLLKKYYARYSQIFAITLLVILNYTPILNAELVINGYVDPLMNEIYTYAEYETLYDNNYLSPNYGTAYYPFWKKSEDLLAVTITSDITYNSIEFNDTYTAITGSDPNYTQYPGNILILGDWENPITLTIAENGKFNFDFTPEITYSTYNSSYLEATASTLRLLSGATANFKNTDMANSYGGYFYLGKLILESGASATFEGDYDMIRYVFPPDIDIGSEQYRASYLGSLTLNPGSAIIQKDKGKFSVEAGYGVLSELQILGNGRESATLTIINGGNRVSENGLFTQSISILMTDDFDFSIASPMLSITSDSTDQTVVGLRGSGLASNYTGIRLTGSIRVVDANGEPTSLKTTPSIGDTFVIVDKLAELYHSGNQLSIFINNNLENTLKNPSLLDGGPFMDWSIQLSEKSNQLVGQVASVNTYKSKPILDGLMSNVIALSNGVDLLADQGIGNAMKVAVLNNCNFGVGIFSAFSGYNQKYETSAHIDYRGFNFIVGPAINYKTFLGSMMAGLVLEGGRGRYDTSTEISYFDAGSGRRIISMVDGRGDNDYIGAGLMARHDFNQGYYVEGSIRAGNINNKFDGFGMGRGVAYEMSRKYYGAHLGAGYIFEYKPGLLMDVYAKGFWTQINGEPGKVVNVGLGTQAKFEDIVIPRTRLGVRYTVSLLEKLKMFFGGAWDYSFGDDKNGRIRATITDNDFPITPGEEPTVEGSSGILELGLDYKPFENQRISISLAGRANLGKLSGGGGTLTLKYDFGGSEEPCYPIQRPAQAPATGDDPGSISPFLTGYSGVKSQAPSNPYLLAAAGDEMNVNNEVVSTLETITVYSEPDWKQILSPGAVSVVVPDKFEGEQKSLGDFLDQLPGLHVNKRGGSGQYTTVNVRGSAAAQVGLYIDGVPQNLSGDASVDFSLYSAENVARIEFYRGYVPIRFIGAPIGGVINIVTKKPQNRSTYVSVGARSLGGFAATGLFTAPLFNGSLLLSAIRDQSQGDFKYTYHSYSGQTGLPNPRWRRNNSHQRTDLMAKWQNENWLFQFGWKEMNRYYPWNTNADGYKVDVDNDLWSYNRHNNQVVIDKTFVVGYRGEFYDLNYGIKFDYLNQSKKFRWEDGPPEGVPQFSNVTPSPGILWSDYLTDRWTITVDASYKLGESNMLEFRGDFSQEQLDVDASFWVHPFSAANRWERLLPGYEQDRWHLQLQDTISLGNDTWITLIGRVDKVDGGSVGLSSASADDNGAENYTWGVAVKKNVNEHWTIKASGGTFVRYPNFYELYGDGVYIKPGVTIEERQVPHVKTEKAQQWDFTIDWKGDVFHLPTTFSATYFSRRTNDMIGLFQTPRFVYYGNYGLATSRGVELEGSLKWNRLDLNFSATWLDTKLVDLVENSVGQNSIYMAEGLPVLNSPEWETFFRGSFNAPFLPLTIFAEHHYTSKIPIRYDISNGPNTMEEESLHLVNMGFRIEFLKDLKLTAGVNDIFNKGPTQKWYGPFHPYSNGQTLPFPKQGRVFYGSLSYHF